MLRKCLSGLNRDLVLTGTKKNLEIITVNVVLKLGEKGQSDFCEFLSF